MRMPAGFVKEKLFARGERLLKERVMAPGWRLNRGGFMKELTLGVMSRVGSDVQRPLLNQYFVCLVTYFGSRIR